jgi:hypothetical protein
VKGKTMNITTVTSEGTLEHYDVSELAIEFDCNAELTCTEPMNRNIHTDTWVHKIAGKSKLTLIENENKLSVKEAARQFPFILLNLSTLEKINFPEREIAYKTLRQHIILGEKVLLFEFNESLKSFQMLFLSII